MFHESDPCHEVWVGCESPIEQILCCAIFCFLGVKAVFGPFDESRLGQLAEIAGDQPAGFLFSQHSIGIYRADFLLVAVNPARRTSRRLAIECDGKWYHAKEEQIARDQRRDEELAEAGYRVIRFTGSTVFKDTRWAIGELRSWLESAGVACRPDVKGSLIDMFTPDPSINAARAEMRRLTDEAEQLGVDVEDLVEWRKSTGAASAA